MSKRCFRYVLWAVLGVCTVLTLAHLAYAVYAYEHCSIIRFVAGELW